MTGYLGYIAQIILPKFISETPEGEDYLDVRNLIDINIHQFHIYSSLINHLKRSFLATKRLFN